jgi:hypothetical protein
VLLVSPLFLVFPAKWVEAAGGPLELGGVLGLVSLPHVIFQTNDGIFFAAESLSDAGGDADALVVVKLHYAPCKPDIILLKMDVLGSLRLPHIFKLDRCRSDKPFSLWLTQNSVIMKRL